MRSSVQVLEDRAHLVGGITIGFSIGGHRLSACGRDGFQVAGGRRELLQDFRVELDRLPDKSFACAVEVLCSSFTVQRGLAG
ncbi:hypothetical protein ACPZ19_48780 [Amycolatopsis lurida]